MADPRANLPTPHFWQRMFTPARKSAGAKAPAAARDVRRVIALCRALLSERGEVSGARLALQVLDAYQSLDAPALEVFFDQLVKEFSTDW